MKRIVTICLFEQYVFAFKYILKIDNENINYIFWPESQKHF